MACDHAQGFETSFNIIFLLELLINFYGKFFFSFWYDPWNVFDFGAPNSPAAGFIRSTPHAITPA